MLGLTIQEKEKLRRSIFDTLTGTEYSPKSSDLVTNIMKRHSVAFILASRFQPLLGDLQVSCRKIIYGNFYVKSAGFDRSVLRRFQARRGCPPCRYIFTATRVVTRNRSETRSRLRVVKE